MFYSFHSLHVYWKFCENPKLQYSTNFKLLPWLQFFTLISVNLIRWPEGYKEYFLKKWSQLKHFLKSYRVPKEKDKTVTMATQKMLELQKVIRKNSPGLYSPQWKWLVSNFNTFWMRAKTKCGGDGGGGGYLNRRTTIYPPIIIGVYNNA